MNHCTYCGNNIPDNINTCKDAGYNNCQPTEDKYVWVIIQDAEIYAYTDARTVEEALDRAEEVGCDQVMKIDRQTAEEIIKHLK